MGERVAVATAPVPVKVVLEMSAPEITVNEPVVRTAAAGVNVT